MKLKKNTRVNAVVLTEPTSDVMILSFDLNMSLIDYIKLTIAAQEGSQNPSPNPYKLLELDYEKCSSVIYNGVKQTLMEHKTPECFSSIVIIE